MSALPPKADRCSAHAHVCFGPKADIDHSITPTVSDDLVNFNRRRAQPPGIDRQPCRHWTCSKSQLRLAGSLLELVDTQLLPQSCRHWLKRIWQLRAQPPWATLFFGMGVKLPAKLNVIDEKRIIAAAICFICNPHKYLLFSLWTR